MEAREDARVRAYAAEVHRVCAEREPQYAWSPEQDCALPGVGAQMAYATAAGHEQQQRILEPGDQRNPTPQRVCEDIEEPSGVEPVAQGSEPEPLPDPAREAIQIAAQVAAEAQAAYEADPNAQTRQVWMDELAALQGACLVLE